MSRTLRVFSLTLLTGALLTLGACRVDDGRTTTTTTTDLDGTAPTAHAEEFRSEMQSRLGDIADDIAEAERRAGDPVNADHRDDHTNRVAELRQEHVDLERRLMEIDATTHDAFRNDYRSFLGDVQGLELRTERLLIMASTSADQVRSTVEQRMGDIDTRADRWTVADGDWRTNRQDRRADVEARLAEIQAAPANQFEGLRSDVESAYSNYRDVIHRAERDHFDGRYDARATTTAPGTTAPGATTPGTTAPGATTPGTATGGERG
jgi:hypothetical protein